MSNLSNELTATRLAPSAIADVFRTAPDGLTRSQAIHLATIATNGDAGHYDGVTPGLVATALSAAISRGDIRATGAWRGGYAVLAGVGI